MGSFFTLGRPGGGTLGAQRADFNPWAVVGGPWGTQGPPESSKDTPDLNPLSLFSLFWVNVGAISASVFCTVFDQSFIIFVIDFIFLCAVGLRFGFQNRPRRLSGGKRSSLKDIGSVEIIQQFLRLGGVPGLPNSSPE